MPKKIDPALRERAVRLVREHRSEYPSQLSSRSHVRKASVLKRCGVGCVRPISMPVNAKATPALSSPRSNRLKAENKRLREDVAVLKAATTFFAEQGPRNR